MGGGAFCHISSKNSNYCELTAQYWAWKNCQDDYIGFMHYRRHLSFNTEAQYPENIYGLVEYPYINNYYTKEFGLDETNIRSIVEQNDVVIAKKWNVSAVGSKNNYDHYKNSDKKLYIKDYDQAINILLKKYPNFKESVNNYNNSNYGYYTNIFIMKKEIFNSYCEWLFDILFELEKITDISHYNEQEARVFGYISEWLLGIYITYLTKQNSFKIQELQRTIVNNVNFVQNNKNINICFTCDNNYIMPLSVAISSLLKNTQTKKTIDIYIIYDYISESKKNKILSLKKLKDNVNIYFIRIDINLFSSLPNPKAYWNYSIYYRYVIASLLHRLDKVIYLDSDLIVNDDIETLYDIDIGGFWLGAIQDLIGEGNRSRLKLEREGFYCNSGVLLMNLQLMRQNNLEKEFFAITQSNKYDLIYNDQDVINIVCNGKIKYLDLSWNLQYVSEFTKVDYDEKEFKEAIKNPKIIHFIGKDKPWHPDGKYRLYRKEYFKYLKYSPWKYYYLLCRDREITRKITIKLLFVIPFIKIVLYKYHKGIIKIFGIPLMTIRDKQR